MPTVKQPRRRQCAFKEGTLKCTAPGTGAPALCDYHRGAISQASGGIGQQLGGLLDQMINGRAPNSLQLEQLMANFAGAVLGRTVTIDEVHTIRTGVRERNPDAFTDPEMWERYVGDAQRVREKIRARAGASARPIDPAMAAKIEHAKALGRARAVLGFSAKEPLNEDLLKGRKRELARKHHPDAGGSTEAMQKVNAAFDLLMAEI